MQCRNSHMLCSRSSIQNISGVLPSTMPAMADLVSKRPFRANELMLEPVNMEKQEEEPSSSSEVLQDGSDISTHTQHFHATKMETPSSFQKHKEKIKQMQKLYFISFTKVRAWLHPSVWCPT